MLNRLREELLIRKPDACLPARLTDEWLALLSESVDALLGDESTANVALVALCTGVVARLLETKGYSLSDLGALPSDELRQYFVRYQLELALEQVHRKTNVKYEQATLETILTERSVATWQGCDM